MKILGVAKEPKMAKNGQKGGQKRFIWECTVLFGSAQFYLGVHRVYLGVHGTPLHPPGFVLVFFLFFFVMYKNLVEMEGNDEEIQKNDIYIIH